MHGLTIRYTPRVGAALLEPPSDQNLPDDVILFMLGREALLTEAKMMNIDFEKYKLDRDLRSLKVQMRQVNISPSLLLDALSLPSSF